MSKPSVLAVACRLVHRSAVQAYSRGSFLIAMRLNAADYFYRSAARQWVAATLAEHHHPILVIARQCFGFSRRKARDQCRPMRGDVRLSVVDPNLSPKLAGIAAADTRLGLKVGWNGLHNALRSARNLSLICENGCPERVVAVLLN